MANETGQTNVDSVLESVERPAEMEQDGRRARDHNLRDKDHVASRAYSSDQLQNGLGIKIMRIQPGGAK